MAGRLDGRSVVVLLAEGFEDLEFWVTVMRLQEEGARPVEVAEVEVVEVREVREAHGLAAPVAESARDLERRAVALERGPERALHVIQVREVAERRPLGGAVPRRDLVREPCKFALKRSYSRGFTILSPVRIKFPHVPPFGGDSTAAARSRRAATWSSRMARPGWRSLRR